MILGFDLFDVTEVNLMSQTTARDNVARARLIAQIFGGDDFIDSFNVFFEYFAALFYPDLLCKSSRAFYDPQSLQQALKYLKI